jgi:Arc/MetJ family transcription regulator
MQQVTLRINEELVKQAKILAGLKTQKAAVEEALRFFINLREQEKIRSLKGKLSWEGNLNEMREGRQL